VTGQTWYFFNAACAFEMCADVRELTRGAVEAEAESFSLSLCLPCRLLHFNLKLALSFDLR
jgi:hypothetical protein